MGVEKIGACGAIGTIRIFFRPFGIKMLAVAGVSVLQCHPYRRIPIVIHGFRLRHHLSRFTLSVRSSLRTFALRAWGVVSLWTDNKLYEALSSTQGCISSDCFN